MLKHDTRPEFHPSFGRRQGRKLNPSKQVLLEELLPRLLYAPQDILQEDGTQPSKARREAGGSEAKGVSPKKIWIEIGFGGGEHLAQLAKNHPEVLMIGAEPYLHGVASLLKYIERDVITNIRIVPEDIRPVLKALPAGSVERIYLLFPDPWRKVKHYKRRIFNHAFLDEASRLLPKGGVVQLATDHLDYSVWMLEHFLARHDFQWQVESCHDWQNPPADWVPTRYEQKAKAQGREPVYFTLIKC